jgi:lysophospholipase L1-like esterase
MIAPARRRRVLGGFLIGITALLLSVALCGPTVAAASQSAESGTSELPPRLVPATAPEFRYEGRFDARDPLGPVIVWQSSRVRVDFEGELLALVFDEIEGQNVFDVEVDGHTRVLPVQAGSDLRHVYLPPLGKGRHRLTLLKRTESMAGLARFRGISVAAGARVFAPADLAYRLRMEFIGDSITAGACDEDGDVDQWKNRISHDGARSYAAMTAAAFGADHRNISVSGMGVRRGYVDVLAGQVWDRIYPRVASPHLDSPRTDLAAWQPEVVFVNLGENDQSFSEREKLPFPDDFADGYVALVSAIRRAYPRSHVVLLRGGMGGGATDPFLRKSWEAAVARLASTDPAIHPFVFGHWSDNHPRVPDHRAMADELVAWLTWQDFMKPWSVRTKGP